MASNRGRIGRSVRRRICHWGKQAIVDSWKSGVVAREQRQRSSTVARAHSQKSKVVARVHSRRSVATMICDCGAAAQARIVRSASQRTAAERSKECEPGLSKRWKND